MLPIFPYGIIFRKPKGIRTLVPEVDLSGTVRARQPVEERSKSKKFEISLSAVSTACVHTLEPKSLVRFCLVCSKLMILYYKAQISIWPF